VYVKFQHIPDVHGVVPGGGGGAPPDTTFGAATGSAHDDLM